MKVTTVFYIVLACSGMRVRASPLQKPSSPELVELEARTLFEETGILDLSGRQSTGNRANELVNGRCGDVIFIFARGSTEPGNLGGTVGPALADQLRSRFPSLVAQGVDYAANIETALLPGGGDPQGIREMTRLWNLAARQCPNAHIVGGGYSQGAALTHRSIEALPTATLARIAGVVTFGDSQRQQSGGRIRGIPARNLLIICNDGDIICEGSLTITPAHLDYVPRVPEATNFLARRVAAFPN